MKFYLIVKFLITAGVVVAASELAKKNSILALVTLALPLTSVLTFFWVFYETGDRQKLASLSWGVFWLVPPSLVFFPVFALLIEKEWSFWLVFLIAALVTLLVFLVYTKILKLFGISF